MHHICMSTAVCLASRNPQQMHKFLFLPREDFCMGEEDLLEKPECRVPFLQATEFGPSLQPSWRNRALRFLLLCFTVDQVMYGVLGGFFFLCLFKVGRISSKLRGESGSGSERTRHCGGLVG